MFSVCGQAKPMVPLQSEFDQLTQTHVLTCFMFPQQSAEEEGEGSDKQTNKQTNKSSNEQNHSPTLSLYFISSLTFMPICLGLVPGLLQLNFRSLHV